MWKSKEQKTLNRILHLLEEVLHYIKPRKAKGKLNMLKVTVGQSGIVFSFTELDQNGKPIAPLGPIDFESSNPAIATVDSSKQVTDPVTLITTVPIIAVAANADGTDGTVDISGTDPATVNKVTAKDTLTVSAIVQVPVATSATGVLSVTPTQVTNVSKNPLALS